jgi:hypothetical protein
MGGSTLPPINTPLVDVEDILNETERRTKLM